MNQNKIQTKPRNLALPVLLVVGVGALCCIAIVVGGAIVYFLRPSTAPITIPEEPQPIIVVTTIIKIVTQEPLETQLPEIPTEIPATLTPTPEGLTPSANVSFGGVHFYLDPSLAGSAKGETIPAANENDAPIWGLEPEHVQFSFTGYVLSGTFHEAKIYFYPIDDFIQLNPDVADTVAELRRVMLEKPTPSSIDNLPFLPLFPAAQYMQAQINYLDFKGGSGLRYLTQYGQDVYPVNNQNMFYTFQGLTDDNKYYISAIFPVSNPVLPDPDTITLDQAFADNFLTYITETEKTLDAQDVSSFTPDLALLDELIASIEINQ